MFHKDVSIPWILVTAVRKRKRLYEHERIEGICCSGQFIPEEIAIQMLEGNRCVFYTFQSGVRALLIVSSFYGRKYLKTENDGYAPNNLLSLPDC